MKNEPFVIERIYDAPIEKVWKAITNRDDMEQWYFKLKEFKPEAGFKFEFTGGDEKMQYLHECIAQEVVPGKKIAYTWRYPDYEGSSLVTWELFEEGAKTRLKLTHAGLETFPEGNPSFAKESFAGGWTYITGTSLKEFVEKNTQK